MRTRTPSIRTLAAIAYERGEEFDPALMLSPALADQLQSGITSGTTVFASCSSADACRCRQETGRFGIDDEGEAPSWFEAGDLVSRLPDTRHGELLAELVF
jgi:hypothetical protein